MSACTGEDLFSVFVTLWSGFQNTVTYVTGPAKTGHICTQILHGFSNFNLMLLCIY